MKNDIDEVAEKLNVNKDEASSSEKQGNRNAEIITIKKEIQENYLLTALSIIAFMDEDDFIDFLKLVEVRYNKRILNRLQKKGWLPSVSYILQNAKETEKEDFTLS